MSRVRAAAMRALRSALDPPNAADALRRLAPAIASLPESGDSPGSDDLGVAHEAALPLPVRRSRGIYYTPRPIVDLLLAEIPSPVERLIDPACGAGAFLVAAQRTRDAFSLFGIDTDPVAVEVARIRLFIGSGADPGRIDALIRQIHSDESLLRDWSDLEGTFDAVVGNPPFVDSETMTKETQEFRAAVRRRYATARGNWDLSIPFVELSLRLARPGGTVAIVVPRQILGSDYAAQLHGLLLRHEIVAIRDVDALGAFEGAAAPVALLTVRKRRPPRAASVRFSVLGESLVPTRSVEWPQDDLHSLPAGHLLAPLYADPPELLHRLLVGTRLADAATISDGATTAEAYFIRDALREATDHDLHSPGVVRLVNTGTVDPFVARWDERDTVYLKRRLRRPVIDRDALARIAPRRLAQSDQHKVVVAGLCRRIEAVALPPGWLCAKSAVLVLPREGVCPFALAAYLNAPSTTDLHRALFSGRSLGRGSLHIAPRQLERLPAPRLDSLAPGGALSDLGRTFPPPDAEALDGAVRACFDSTTAGTIRSP